MVESVMELYKGTKSRMKTKVGTSDEFEIGVEVNLGSALSLPLFIPVMEVATKEARGEAQWELLYADDLVVNSETAEVREKFHKWKEGRENTSLKINMDKTKYRW